MRIAGTGLLAVLSLHNVTTQETRTGRQDKRHGFTCITDFQIEHRCTLHIRIFYCSNLYPTRCNVTQLILSGNCSTCFGWYHHPSSGAQTSISTASGICHIVNVICRYCLLHKCIRQPQHTQTSSNYSTIAADSINGVTNVRSCRYNCLCS